MPEDKEIIESLQKEVVTLKEALADREALITEQAAEIKLLKEKSAKGGAKEDVIIEHKKKSYKVVDPHFNAIVDGKVLTCKAQDLQGNKELIEYLLKESPESLIEIPK